MANIYGNAFSAALDRLEDAAYDLIIQQRREKSAAEKEYRATMMNVMMKNAPHINYSAFGDPVSDPDSFKAASSVYSDWLNTSKKASGYNPVGSVLSEEAAMDLTPPNLGDPYTDVSELAVTGADIDIAGQWITGEGDQARSMGWEGLINQIDEDGVHYIDDADYSELIDMGLIRSGETWEDARPKLVQRWHWWKGSYKANNETFYGVNEYKQLEDEEIARRNTAIQELATNDPDYATGRKDLQNINNIIQNGVLSEHKTKYKDENDVLQIDSNLYYNNVILPAGLIVMNEDEEMVALSDQQQGAFTVEDLAQIIELNRADNPEWVADMELLQKFSSFSTVEEVVSLLTQQNGLPMQRLRMISPQAADIAVSIINKAKNIQRKEDDFGVSRYKSSGDLINYKTQAAISLEAYESLNIDLGLNTGGTGLVDVFKQAYQSGSQQDLSALKMQLDELTKSYVIRANSGTPDPGAEWIIDYLKSMDPNGNLSGGMYRHFEKLLVEE